MRFAMTLHAPWRLRCRVIAIGVPNNAQALRRLCLSNTAGVAECFFMCRAACNDGNLISGLWVQGTSLQHASGQPSCLQLLQR